MKHKNIGFILCAAFVLIPILLGAQTVVGNETDSLDISKEHLVQVAFRKIAQSDVLGGVSVMNLEELLLKNYNTYSLDNLQGYIGGWNGNSLWGMNDYLVLVDGVPRNANNVLPSEIEQITFLKGGSAVVLYGSRAAKGVIYITTKRGGDGNLKINVRANTGYNVSKSYPKYLGSAEYMTLYNEALVNDGLTPSFSDNHASGTNPYRYPDVDFYSSEFIKKAANRTDVTTEITGGNDRARFYSNIGYYRQGDLLKIGEAANNNIDRLNIRGNIDLKINQDIKATVNANATFYNARTANSAQNYWTHASTLRPHRVAPLIPLSFIDENDITSWNLVNTSSNLIDGKYFLAGTQNDLTNVFADYYASGYSTWTSRSFQFDTGIEINLGKMLSGLTFQTQFAVDYSTAYTSSYNNTYAIFIPTWYNYNGNDVIAGLGKQGDDKKDGVQNVGGGSNQQTLFFSGQFNYKKKIEDRHNLSAMLIASGYQVVQSQVYHPNNNTNLGLQLSYNYMGKYYADLGSAIVHSAKLAEGNRQAFSPSVSLGWKPGKESFLENSEVVDELSLSLSASILNTDLDITDNYLYSANYTQASGAWWGWYDGAVERSTNSLRGENLDLTFIKRKEISANISGSLWNKLLLIDASAFMNTMEGLLIRPNTVFPNYFFTNYPDASFIPFVNFNNDKRTGFDFNVKLNKQIGGIDYSLGVAGTYYKVIATKRDENFEFAYQNRQGKAVDGIWGWKSDGFFQSQDEINNSPEQKFGGTIKPGDIKYVDQNGDDIIDQKDEVFLARGGWYGAPFTLGVNFTAKWKNLTFFALGTGYFGGYAMKNSSYYWVFGTRKYSEIVRDRWTEATKETATYPRLTTEVGNNNFRNSDFWLYKTDRFNIAKVQITYDLPANLLQNFFIKGISTYISGANLLTISKEREILEMNITSAPQTRFYNLGVKAVF